MRVFVAVAACVLLMSCARERPPVSEEAMLPLVIELHLADALSTQLRDTLHPNREKNQDSLSVWTLRILERNKMTQAEFSEAMDWYRDHPEKLQALYERAADSLERVKR